MPGRIRRAADSVAGAGAAVQTAAYELNELLQALQTTGVELNVTWRGHVIPVGIRLSVPEPVEEGEPQA